METEDILMCPGPNEIADRVIRAMLRSAACPVYDEFQEFYEQTLDMLAQVFQTTSQVIPLPGSGRSGLESAITSVVERDERETLGLREILNYGHTFAHAFETAGRYSQLQHGEAVAIGMICAGPSSPDRCQRTSMPSASCTS